MTARDEDDSTPDNASRQESVDNVFQLISRAFDDAVAAVRMIPEPRRAFDDATHLAEKVRGMADTAAQVRAEAAARVHRAEGLSVGKLAQRLGISKARAEQLLRMARRARDGHGEK
ncbi:hypothetical protein [Spongiactinospora sp. TRM90649]|uniref:hypothetical protein n=1 Tax=Spongiactinospora sp. TRM90649 TaxID=3031114 RepID=UPI0023FA3C1E|nr:hypothetical protein [Spongiactinospora sp. TRM90649]MDF5751943.1 hypothetical protein [Spongiactinospora sp. TRM90649]